MRDRVEEELANTFLSGWCFAIFSLGYGKMPFDGRLDRLIPFFRFLTLMKNGEKFLHPNYR